VQACLSEESSVGFAGGIKVGGELRQEFLIFSLVYVILKKLQKDREQPPAQLIKLRLS